MSDRGFKKLLASRSSLTNFLNGVMRVEKSREIDKLKFKTKRISYGTSDAEGEQKKTWCFDIRAQTRDGRNLPELTTEEKKARCGQTYELPETICIWICNFAVPNDSTETWDDWMLYSGNELKKGKHLRVLDRIRADENDKEQTMITKEERRELAKGFLGKGVLLKISPR